MAKSNSLFIPPIENEYVSKSSSDYPALGLSLYGGLGLPVGITHGVGRANNKHDKIEEVLFFEAKYFRWNSEPKNSICAEGSTAPHLPARKPTSPRY